jgi:hypothetical protein
MSAFGGKADITRACSDVCLRAKTTCEQTECSNLFDYGSLDDPQSQPPAGTSVAAQNVNVAFV